MLSRISSKERRCSAEPTARKTALSLSPFLLSFLRIHPSISTTTSEPVSQAPRLCGFVAPVARKEQSGVKPTLNDASPPRRRRSQINEPFPASCRQRQRRRWRRRWCEETRQMASARNPECLARATRAACLPAATPPVVPAARRKAAACLRAHYRAGIEKGSQRVRRGHGYGNRARSLSRALARGKKPFRRQRRHLRPRGR